MEHQSWLTLLALVVHLSRSGHRNICAARLLYMSTVQAVFLNLTVTTSHYQKETIPQLPQMLYNLRSFIYLFNAMTQLYIQCISQLIVNSI